MYQVKEIFYSLQGEGAYAGRPSLFIRFTGCNLWNGIEIDREQAICSFCDTDFIGINGTGGGKYKTPNDLWQQAKDFLPAHVTNPYVIFTGGEPMLQLDRPLIDEFKKQGATIAIETNGTIKVPDDLDWICVSPKSGSEIIQTNGNELKLVLPQEDYSLKLFENWDFDHFFIQPLDGPGLDENTRNAISLCKENPKWRLSLQTHKLLNIK